MHAHRTIPPCLPITILLSDSLSSLQSLQDPYTTQPLIQRIQLSLLSLFSMNFRITFAWIPEHIGFSNHDMVDEAAKEAISHPKITNSILSPASDLKSFYRNQILNVWFKDWYQLPDNKPRKIINKPSLWSTSLRPKRLEEVCLARLRI